MSFAFIASAIVFVVAYAIVISEKLNKAFVMVVAACVLVSMRIMSAETAFEAVDFEVIYLLGGMMVQIGILAETGFFQWVALSLAKLAKGRPVLLLIYLACGTAMLSAFLDNVTTVLLVAPITFLVCSTLDVPATPFLIVQALASNIGGAATLIGDPPNIIIGSAAGLSFNDFIVHISPCVLIVSIVCIGMLYLFFGKKFSVSREKVASIMEIDPKQAISDFPLMWKSLIIFGITIVGFVLSKAIEIPPSILAMTGGAILALWQKKLSFEHMISKVEWDTMLFFVGLFMLISGLEAAGVIAFCGEKLLSFTGGNVFGLSMVVLWFSGIVVNIVSSTPLVTAMVPVIQHVIEALPAGSAENVTTIWWALALGAGLGGNGTVLGTPATIVLVGIINRQMKNKITFFEFLKYGIPTVIVSLTISAIYLWIRYF